MVYNVYMKRRNLLFLTALVGLLVAAGILHFLRLSSSEKPVSTKVATIDASNGSLCSDLKPEKLEEVYNYPFDAASSTKSIVSGSLASQTCIYTSQDGEENKSVSIVAKYQTSENSSPTIEEVWQETRKNRNEEAPVKVSRDAFISSSPVMLYVYDGTVILAVSANTNTENLKKTAELVVD